MHDPEASQPTPARPTYHPGGGGSFLDLDFDRSPFTLAWEITQACGLACLHCRAEARPWRDPRELSTEEGFRLIDQVVELGCPILVVTGGDPLMRPDVYDLLRHAVSRGLRVALSPSATGKLTRAALERVKDTGAHMLHLSLDGSSAEVHDAFRGVKGSYQRTIDRMRDAADLGLLLQVGTTVSRYNLDDLESIGKRVAEVGADVWTVFFLVPTGRAQLSDMLTPQQHEDVFRWLYQYGQSAPFHVRSIAAQHYRRVVLQAQETPAPSEDAPRWDYTGVAFSARVERRATQGRGVNDGSGFCFVSHTGDVCPSGFLQVPAGNVCEQPLAEIYRDSTVFRELRDRGLLKGKCGACEYRDVCGGSRARAYSLTGDYLASDPSCVYVPRSLREPQAPRPTPGREAN